MNRIGLAMKMQPDFFHGLHEHLSPYVRLVLMDIWAPTDACSNTIGMSTLDIKGIYWWEFPPQRTFWLPVGNVRIRLNV